MKDNFDDYVLLERKRIKRLESENELMKKALTRIREMEGFYDHEERIAFAGCVGIAKKVLGKIQEGGL